jgi:hypothetical protein
MPSTDHKEKFCCKSGILTITELRALSRLKLAVFLKILLDHVMRYPSLVKIKRMDYDLT